MSSLPVAAQRRASPRLPLGLVALVVVLAIGAGAFVGAMAVANRTASAPSVATTTVKHHSAVPPAATSTTQMARYREVVASLAAAVQRHDYERQYLLGRQLDAVLTPAVIGTIYQERTRLAASLEAAVERHDTHSRALISRQLANICGPAAVKSRLDFCN